MVDTAPVPREPKDIVEIPGVASPPPSDADADCAHPSGERAPNPFLSVHFRCCGVYGRVYRNRERTRYEGHCPKCAKPVRVGIGPGGTSARAFEAW